MQAVIAPYSFMLCIILSNVKEVRNSTPVLQRRSACIIHRSRQRPLTVVLHVIRTALPRCAGYPQLHSSGAGAALIERTLLWHSSSTADSAAVVYGMAGDSSGSHFLEAALWLLPMEFAAELCQRVQLHSADKLEDYCKHQVVSPVYCTSS
jgi:hypothetical protein